MDMKDDREHYITKINIHKQKRIKSFIKNMDPARELITGIWNTSLINDKEIGLIKAMSNYEVKILSISKIKKAESGSVEIVIIDYIAQE